MNALIRGCGISLLLGAALLVLTNTILTPLMPAEEAEAVLRTSDSYLVRMIAALVTPHFFVFGVLGLHLAQLSRGGAFGTIAFVVLMIGNLLVIGLEWSNLFVMRAVAETAPDALAVLDQSTTLNVGFGISIGLFTLGWILMSISVWRTRVLPRYAPVLTLAGLISIPVLSASPFGPLAGQIAGNVIFGAGLAGLGAGLLRSGEETPAEAT